MECIFIEAVPVLCRVNPSGEAVEQADMIIFLQLLDRQADGRLSQMQAVRCEGDAFLLIYGDKNFHMTQSHGGSSKVIG